MKTWKTRNGEEILISEMETDHIENCIKTVEDWNIEQNSWKELEYLGTGKKPKLLNVEEDIRIIALTAELRKR